MMSSNNTENASISAKADNVSAIKDQNIHIVQQYLDKKAAQIQAKFGIEVDKASYEGGSENYVVTYMKTLASERVVTITKSIASSFRIYLYSLYKYQDADFCQRYHQLLFREIVFYLTLLQLNKSWSMSALSHELLEIIAGISTIMLNPPKGHETAYITVCSLLLCAISTGYYFLCYKTEHRS